MANTKSAQKAVRQQARRTKANTSRKQDFRSARKDLFKVLSNKKADGLNTAVANFYKAIDKAAKTRAISANTAARYKSRAMAKINKAAK